MFLKITNSTEYIRSITDRPVGTISKKTSVEIPDIDRLETKIQVVRRCGLYITNSVFLD